MPDTFDRAIQVLTFDDYDGRFQLYVSLKNEAGNAIYQMLYKDK